MITPAQRAEIRRLYYSEHWKLGTIATQLGLHRETVRAAVEREPGAGRPALYRPSALDPYLPFIRDTLAQYPRLRATRIHEMVRQRGYPGSVNRVPTRSVQKYTLRTRPETSGAHEAVQGGPGHARQLGDGGLRDAQLEEAPDLVLLAVEP